MDPDAFQHDYQRWLHRFLNRESDAFQRERQKEQYEIDCLEHMWALPEREEP